MSFTCVFCRREYDELPFLGCCVSCYTTNFKIRAIVDEAHPQTVSPLVEMCDEVQS